ncbi:MAG: hypothetical protein ACT6TH_15375 [Brevundimonas sp.]|uniref:hypothetical protein n=1 Tax=Brevundimonas sp. TaxID=1871086 RepID=UPI0040335C92
MTPALYSTARLLIEAVLSGQFDDARFHAKALKVEIDRPLSIRPWTPWNQRGVQ